MKKAVLIFLAVLIIFGSLFLDTFVHEFGHEKAAKQEGINFEINKLNFFSVGNEWGKGEVVPASFADCEKFNSLSIESRKKIFYAGVNAELLIFVPLFIFFACLAIINWKKYIHKNRVMLWFLIMIAFLFLIIILFTVYGNVFASNPNNDWHAVNKMFNCSLFQ